jgi:CheY-like chemotaxis protein
MKILVVDGDASIREEVYSALQADGYDVRSAATVLEAIAFLDSTRFDCILIGVPLPAKPDKTATLREMRQLVIASAVILVTALPIEALIEHALTDGSIQLISHNAVGRIIRAEETADLPILLVASSVDAGFMEKMRRAGKRAITARTLPFTLNTLADGWCQVVLLEVDIPGLTYPDKVALFDPVALTHLAILASGNYARSSGISCLVKPNGVAEIIALVKRVGGARLGTSLQSFHR